MRTGLLVVVCLSACTPSEQQLDEEAAAENVDGKADTYSVTRLERATAAEVATSFVVTRGAELTECFDAYKQKFDPNATMLTEAVTTKFDEIPINSDIRGPCSEWWDLGVIVNGVLEMQGATALTLAEVIDAMDDWALPQLVMSSVSGYVDIDEADLLFYADILATQDKNASDRATNPSGVDIAELRDQFRMVRRNTTLDSQFLNPVTFPAGALDGSAIFRYLRAAFPLRSLSLTSTGYTAIADFAGASEGPDGDPAFDPIATAIRKRSIKKRFYYSGEGERDGDGWSSNVLILVDEHGQAWGMQMGYSE